MTTTAGRPTMPAIERSFSDPLPRDLYLDTDIMVSYLVVTQPHHHRCQTFLQRIAQHGRTRVHLSSLTWMEFANVITRERFRLALPEDLRRRYRVDLWEQPRVRQAYIRSLLGALDELLMQFATAEVPLTPEIRMLAVGPVIEHNLRAYDAVHLASAAYAGVADFASLDERFRRVDGLYLWNDGIHRR